MHFNVETPYKTCPVILPELRVTVLSISFHQCHPLSSVHLLFITNDVIQLLERP